MYKKIRMNPQVLSSMFIGFQRRLFSAHKENDMFSISEGAGECTIFFKDEFWQKYVEQLQRAKDQGKFASSNANSSWNTLLSFVKSATICELPDNCKDYSIGLKMYM